MRLLLLSVLLLAAPAAGQADPGPDRSPLDLALTADGAWAVVANAGADTASLVDLSTRKAVAEVPVGRRPVAVALDGPRAIVSNALSGTLTVLDLQPPRLAVAATIPVGLEPRGVALRGPRAWVALAGEDAVAAVDLASKAVERSPSGDEPWDVALSPDGTRVAVSNALSRTVSVHDAVTLKRHYAVAMRGHNLRRLAPSPDGTWMYVPNIAERGLPTSRDNIDRGWVVANRLSRVPLLEDAAREAVSLDPRGKAVGDVEDVAVSPDGRRLALAAGGTHELLLLGLPLPFIAFGGPGDHIDPAVLKDPDRFRRVPLGGRPVAAAFTPDGARVVVANYLLNSVQVVDVAQAALVAAIPLGGPETPSLERRGEMVFYDAGRSFHQWYSCHTCHVEGHTTGGTFDTLNDGRYGNAKKTLSLRGVARNGPWTWHGWQTDLPTALAHSMKTTMQGPEPAKEEVEALHAFVKTIDHAPPAPLSEAATRGEIVFKAKGCGTCHAGPDFTDGEVHKTGLEAPDDVHKGYKAPTLRGVGRRNPYLHDGRARTLEEVLTKHHRASTLTRRPDPSPEELADLVAYLKGL